jgi:hypothetical protein
MIPALRSIPGVLAALALAACSTTHIDRTATASDERLYAELFPYYAEVCAISELKKKPGFGVDISSGMGGHSILYLNGVCRDDSAGYPVIRLCPTDTPLSERGVGLSVNAHFKNAIWVATQGRDFVFHGTLQPGERLTRAVYEQTQARAKAMGIYDGIEFHDEVFDDKPPRMSRRDYMYEVSVATDYAIGFGRDRYCARVPLNREKMTRIVAYLNGLNAVYRSGAKEFEWNVFNNNCSHVNHNTLATAGIWSRWPTGQSPLLAAFDFPVPKNEFVDLMRRTNDFPIGDPEAVYDDTAARRALLQDGVLPTQPGALAEAEPADQANDLYDTDLRLIFYDDPIFGSYAGHFAQIYADPRYTDLQANLQHFAALYHDIERDRPPSAEFVAAHGAQTQRERDELTQFYARYDGAIAQAAARVDSALAAIARTRSTAAAPALAGPPEMPASPPQAAPGVPRN